MKHINFEYEVYVNVQFTAGDLRLLHHFAERHYSIECKQFFVPGPYGTGNSWRYFSFDSDIEDPLDESIPADTLSSSTHRCAKWDHLDICLKILEGMQYERDPEKIAHALRLDKEIRGILEAILGERSRIRGEAS